MKSIKLQLTLPRGLARPALSGLMIMAMAAQLLAQLAPTRTPTPAELTKYDANKNGILDPGELSAMDADRSKVAPVVVTETNPAAEETIVLSPFEVLADDRGYQATNTMSGTRFNTKLEDLAASIEVITKEQMADFAMLDINDVFLYAGNTEGTGTFNDMLQTGTANQNIDDNAMMDPNNANRVRGLGSANVSQNGYESSNRVPLDPLDADGIEVSRGPNSIIFGVGRAGGSVNIVGASANLQRGKTQVQLRGDSFDGWRASLDVNRVLLKDKLAVRATAAYQHDGFHLKPSGVDSKRLTAYLQYRPFKKTTLKASYQDYRAWGNRPNTVPPMDGYSYWMAQGSPTWNPITRTATYRSATGGHTVGQTQVITNNTLLPGLFDQGGNPSWNQFFVDQNVVVPSGNPHFTAQPGIQIFMKTVGINSTTDPAAAGQRNIRRFMFTNPFVMSREGGQPLFPGIPAVSDKSVYDWSSLNLATPNFFKDDTQTMRVTLEQSVFRTSGQSLDLQLGWVREDSERYGRFLMGNSSAGGSHTGRLTIDATELLLDGTPNPFYLRPLIQSTQVEAWQQPLRFDTYRGQFAYQLDFTKDGGWRRWLGRHALAGFGEYKETTRFTLKFKDYIINNPAWLPGVIRAGQGLTSTPTTNDRVRTAYRFYLGEPVAFGSAPSIVRPPATPAYGDYTFIWGQGVPGEVGTWNHETVTLGQGASTGFSGNRKIQKTGGFVLQSQFVNGRVIPTFGRRYDKIYTRNTAHPNSITPPAYPFHLYDEFGMQFNWGEDLYNSTWLKNADGSIRQTLRKGATETRGVVVKPFRGWSSIDGAAQSGAGLTGFFANALRGLNLHYNDSESFQPAGEGWDLFRNEIPDPRGEGKEYGFSLNLLNNKLYLRANWYETLQLNNRGGPSSKLANALNRIDFNLQNDSELRAQAGLWTLEANPLWTTQEVTAEVNRIMQVPWDENLPGSPSEPDDLESKGYEIELYYNPNNYWRVKAGFTHTKAVQATVSGILQPYFEQRIPIWESIIDPRSGEKWLDTLYGGAETPRDQMQKLFLTPFAMAKASEGKIRNQLRQYKGNLVTSYRLAGITEQPILKRFTVGGALRWTDKAVIGYHGVQQLPDLVTDLDGNRPIHDKAHLYADAFVSYRTRIWHDKIGATVQLNVRNLQQDGAKLQPIAAWPDGTLRAFRIVPPRQFILTTTFDF